MLDGRYYKPNNIGIVTPQLITVIVYGSRVPSLGETDVHALCIYWWLCI